jgi:hypothetical protein
MLMSTSLEKLTTKSGGRIKRKSLLCFAPEGTWNSTKREFVMLLRTRIIVLTGVIGFALSSSAFADGVKNTGTIREPVGYAAECFATNLDTAPQILTATIYDWTGANVTSFSSCGLADPGTTCRAGTTFAGRELRCQVTTSGPKKELAGSLNTYPSVGAPTSVSLSAQD